MKIPEHLREDLYRLLPERPAILVLDFDGVVTDDRVYVLQDGTEAVACTRGDGLGVTLLRRAGFPVLILSSEENPVVGARARKLKVEFVQGARDKRAELERLFRERGIDPANAVYVGNDVNDVGCLELCGCGLAVADAHPAAKKAALGVLSHAGGRGAVREAAELVLVRIGRGVSYEPGARDAAGP